MTDPLATFCSMAAAAVLICFFFWIAYHVTLALSCSEVERPWWRDQ